MRVWCGEPCITPAVMLVLPGLRVIGNGHTMYH